MFRIRENRGQFIAFELSGKLSKHDWAHLAPQFERIIESEGKLRAVVELEHFDGLEASGLVEDLRFGFAHRKDLDRVAIVGERRWQDWATRLADPFVSGEVRFFDKDEREEAYRWARRAPAPMTLAAQRTY
jgi:hypothetical protein